MSNPIVSMIHTSLSMDKHFYFSDTIWVLTTIAGTHIMGDLYARQYSDSSKKKKKPE